MQDRKLLQDDNRGLDQGVLDNKPTLSIFRMIVEEPLQEDCTSEEPSLSATSFSALESLNHPLHYLLPADPDILLGLNPTFQAGIGGSTGIDIHLVSLSVINTMREHSVGVVVHRTRLNKCYHMPSHSHLDDSNGKVNISSILSTPQNIIPSSLSFLYKGTPVSSSQSIDICSFSMLAFIIPNQTT